MNKEQLIRPIDAREYINFQFSDLASTLQQFDFNGMADIVRAAQIVFQSTSPDSHPAQSTDYTLVETDKTKNF